MRPGGVGPRHLEGLGPRPHAVDGAPHRAGLCRDARACAASCRVHLCAGASQRVRPGIRVSGGGARCVRWWCEQYCTPRPRVLPRRLFPLRSKCERVVIGKRRSCSRRTQPRRQRPRATVLFAYWARAPRFEVPTARRALPLFVVGAGAGACHRGRARCAACAARPRPMITVPWGHLVDVPPGPSGEPCRWPDKRTRMAPKAGTGGGGGVGGAWSFSTPSVTFWCRPGVPWAPGWDGGGESPAVDGRQPVVNPQGTRLVVAVI